MISALPRLPGEWTAGLRSIAELVTRASREVQLLTAVTPVDAHRERARLVRELRAQRRVFPDWAYLPVAHDDLRRALDAAERVLAGSDDPLRRLYLDRIRELSLEASLCAAAGTSDLPRLARQRFDHGDIGIARVASNLCALWLAEPAPAAEGPTIRSDDVDPRLLLSRMRATVSRAELPFDVIAQPTLAPLAATGDRVILVATGRPVHEEDAVRTVLHEVEGHARPRARSLSAPLLLFRVGTAGGGDDQEGRALLLEERAGMLGPRRRRQLAARHRAVESMTAGASFDDVASSLVDRDGLDAVEAIVIAERAFRGGNGKGPGLGRERLYLEAFVRVSAHLAARPEDETWLEAGQVAVGAVNALRSSGVLCV